MYILGGFFSGVFMSLMNFCNSALSQAIGNLSASLVTNLVGILLILPLFFWGVGQKKITFDASIPWWSYTAGIPYVFTTLLNNYSIPRLGVTLALVISLMGQTVTSLVLENIGAFGYEVRKTDKNKLIGLGFIGLGAVVMLLW